MGGHRGRGGDALLQLGAASLTTHVTEEDLMRNPWPVAPVARYRLVLPAAVVGLGLVLGACGGDNGGGGNPATEQHLQVMVINLSSADVTATSSSGGDPQTVAQCTASTVDFPLSDP